jgi:transposase InsO family protein
MMKLIAFISGYIILCLRLLSPGGVRAVASENIILRQQLITLSRKQKRAPGLTFFEKITFGLFASMISARRLTRIAIILKPATLLKFHKALIHRKYSLLFSNKASKKPGPKGPDEPVIHLIIEMKKGNPSYGYRRIAMQIANAFGIIIDKDVVRRVLSKHYKNNPEDIGPSWLTFIGHMKDSLWSIDLFRSESIHLKTHWIMVIMDQFTRRIIGFAAHKGPVTGIDLCCMFHKIISRKGLPKYLSSDNDPLFHFYQWKANCRILDIEEIKSVPYVPTSHPFVERLIGSVRREILDKTFYWNAYDLQNKLELFQNYYNEERAHHGIDGITPLKKADEPSSTVVSINHYRWKKHCHGLFELPIAA